MKTLIGLLLIINTGIAGVLPNLDAISQALAKGDVETLSRYFDDSVEISIPGEEDIFSKAEAKQVMAQFFTKNPPIGFSQLHQGTSRGKDSVYCIGNLKTKGKTYRGYFLLKVENGKQYIQELRFEAE